MTRTNFIDETGHIYGKLIVVEAIRRPEDKKTKWKCKCECGNEIVCSGSDLRAGKRTSCGKHCNSIKNEVGNIYGFLTVLAKDETPATSFPDKSVHWICKCNNCGKIKSISGKSLRNGDTRSCGCIKSAGETVIAQILDELGWRYEQEYTFDDLISPFSKLKLRFDFAIFENNNLLFLLEYQGAQHEQQVKYFGNKLEKIQGCDEEKRLYCMKKDIPLIITTHIKEKVPNKEALKEMLIQTREELLNEISN